MVHRPRTSPRPKPVDNGWEHLRMMLIVRSGGFCEVTGAPLSDRWSAHHRQPRGSGGTTTPNVLGNLLAVTGDGVSGSHGWIESNRTESYKHGWLVKHPTNPVTVPVTLPSGRRVYLNLDTPFYTDLDPIQWWDNPLTSVSR